MKKIFFILFILAVIPFISAEGKICIDFDAPEKVVNIITTVIDNSVELDWVAPLDLPSCSGIDYYEVYRNGGLVNVTNSTSYSESLAEGLYSYRIDVIDLAGHRTMGNVFDVSIVNMVIVSSGGGGSGGDGSSVTVDEEKIIDWICHSWSSCIDDAEERLCYDAANPRNNKIESRGCEGEIVSLSSGGSFSESVSEVPTRRSGFSRITGLAIAEVGGVVTTPAGAGLTIGILVLAFFIVRKKRRS